MTHPKLVSFVAILALIVGGFLSGCDSTEEDEEFDTREVQYLFDEVSSELSLDSAQTEDYGDALRPHDRNDREPGFMWEVAAELSETLTEEQKEDLLNRTEDLERPDDLRGLRGFPGGGGFYGIGPMIGSSPRHGSSPLDQVLDLTEEQSDAIEAIHTAYREDIEALRAALDDGTLPEDDFIREMKSLHEDLRTDIGDVLTDEQITALDQFREVRAAEFEAFRDEVNEKRNEVLGLTTEQAEFYDGLVEDQIDTREVLRDQFLAGDITGTEFSDAVNSLKEATHAALTVVLDETQMEIVLIHDALAVRMTKRGHKGMRRGDLTDR